MKNIRNWGFTLIELLVALFIFAIISVLATTGLYTVFQSKEHLQVYADSLSELQLASALLRQDFLQVIDRSIYLSGTQVPALFGDATSIGFTRDGYANPHALQNRSHLQRVYYSAEQGKLLRKATTVLDSNQNPSTTEKKLLDDYSKITFSYLDEKGKITNKWDSQKTSDKDVNAFPAAIIVELESAPNQKLTLVFKLSARPLKNEQENA